MAGRPPRFIYFDMGNVLLYFSHERQAQQIAAVSGTTAAEVYKLLYQDGLHWAAERGEVSPLQFFDRFCLVTGTNPDRMACERASNEIFSPNTTVAPLVAQLHIAGYPLGVLSNTSEAHWNYCLARFRLLELFRIQALSFRLGAMKPDDKIYLEATRLAGVLPGEIFFTDDRQDNIAAAQRAGWDAVLFESASQLSSELRNRGVLMNY